MAATRDPDPRQQRPFPRFPGLLKALGPGVIWLAMAQGSGELVWWPYMIARYGLAFLFLLVPACLLQVSLNYHIGSYTLLTGESVFQGFLRMHRGFAIGLWVLMTISFLWFGAFASSGGTALAALTEFPAGWSPRGRTLFWAYASMAVMFVGIVLSRRVYRFIEVLMWCVSVVTILGLTLACFHADVRAVAGEFARGLVVPSWPENATWDPGDATKLLTAIAFAGLGGFWAFFYSYWLREKGAGMAAYTRSEAGTEPPLQGFSFAATDANMKQVRRWKRYLVADSCFGILGNIATTLMTCLLAYAFLHPGRLAPEGYKIAVVQAQFFESSWGVGGRIVFLFVAACFLADSWVVTLDAVSRVHTDFLRSAFPRLARIPFRKSYFAFVLGLTAVTAVTLCFDDPGEQIQLSAVIGFLGTVTFSFAFLILNHRTLRRLVPTAAALGPWAFAGMLISALVYLGLAITYFVHLWRS